MSITSEQINAVKNLISGYEEEVDPHSHHLGLDDYLNTIISAREDMKALLRIHQEFSETGVLAALRNAKDRAKVAVDALSTLLN